MSSAIGQIFGGKKADTSAIDAQMQQLREQQAASKAEAERMRSETAEKNAAIRRRRAGSASLIMTSPLGVSETLG